MTTLEKKLESLKGSRIVTLKTKTIVELLKKSRITKQPCPYSLVERICERNGIIGVNYENAVNNQREREEHDYIFEAKELWKGKGRYISPYIIEHVDSLEHYLAFMSTNVGDNLPAIAHDVWYCDGAEIEPDTISEYLPGKSSGSKRQETDKEIIWRTINVKNVIGVKGGSSLTYA